MRTQMIIDELTNRGYKVKAITVSKNNVKKEAIAITMKQDIDALIYTDTLIDNAPINEIIDEILHSACSNMNKFNLFVNQLSAKGLGGLTLMVGLQRQTKENIIKRDVFLPGIEEYLYIAHEESSVKLNTELLNVMGLSEQEAWEKATNNLMQNTQIIDMNEIFPLSPFPAPMYVITTRDQCRGAAAILNHTALQQLAHIFETDELVLLPSSIHEFIVVPYNKSADKDCTQMVKDINNAEVKPEEQLADCAFLYDVNTKSVTIL